MFASGLSPENTHTEFLLNYSALAILIFTIAALCYGMIAIRNIPYEIAKKRNHPHQRALKLAGTLSLFTLHLIWPLLWIWALLYRPQRLCSNSDGENRSMGALFEDLLRRVEALEARAEIEEPANSAKASSAVILEFARLRRRAHQKLNR